MEYVEFLSFWVVCLTSGYGLFCLNKVNLSCRVSVQHCHKLFRWETATLVDFLVWQESW